MDVRSQPRNRVFSILNDNDSPSFQIPRLSPAPTARPQPRTFKHLERPSLLRQAQYKRTSSFSSSGSDSPPLLRLDSSSSRSSGSSMDSTPSPITPAYAYNDAGLVTYDSLLRQDANGFITSSSTITPFMEQQMMIMPTMGQQFPTKMLNGHQYPSLPALAQQDVAQIPTPTPSNTSVPIHPAPDKTTPASAAPPVGKKNKYPCPYAQSHTCGATFTTSGHAARHGKKHTGEKGVHCPVCNKAFTRKDNMKQHERTHKGSISGSASEDSSSIRSKAAITRDAQKARALQKQDSASSEFTGQSSMIPSPLSQTTSIGAPTTEVPVALEEQTFYPDPSNTGLMPVQSIPDNLSGNSLYPPLADDALLTNVNSTSPLTAEKPAELPIPSLPVLPPLARGFSDLDTLAQAAESFNPYYQSGM